MKKLDTMQLRRATCLSLGMFAAISGLAPLLAAGPALAGESYLSGQSTTLLRARRTLDKKDLVQAYEYLSLSAGNLDPKGSLSFEMGGWGRVDLGDKSTDKNQDGDLQYGYLSYRPGKHNLVVNLGRQFVTEGVASEKLDGIYLRSDLRYGFAAAAYVGAPVVTETDSKGGDLIYGTRISQSLPGYYSLGVSGLKAEQGSNRYREEEALDVWLHPVQQLDLVGRSSYNSVTNGWMEHDYKLNYTPLNSLSLTASASRVNYDSYFFHMTSSVFSLVNPSNTGGKITAGERVDSYGGSVAYTPLAPLTVTVDYKNYNYAIAGDANYYGGKASLTLPESFVAGFGVHRMDGTTDALRYCEYRVFAAKKFGKLDLAADFLDVEYDSRINGVKSASTVVCAASYEITPALKVGADLAYAKNPDFDNEVSGLAKLAYSFDTRPSTEGRTK